MFKERFDFTSECPQWTREKTHRNKINQTLSERINTMIDITSRITDILEMNYSIKEKIEDAVDMKLQSAVDEYLQYHRSLDDMVMKQVDQSLWLDDIEEMIESAIEGFVQDAL